MNFWKNIIVITAINAAMFSSCQENIDSRAEREAKEFTRKNCPTPIIDNTRTDSLVFEANTRTLHYYYTLVGPADNKTAFTGRHEELKNILISSFRASTNLKMYIDAGINFKLTYHSEKKTQQKLYETTLTAEELSGK